MSAGPGAAITGTTGGSLESLAAEVTRLRAVLDLNSSTADTLLQALEALKALGSLPTKVLSDTLIGKTVNQLAKASSDEAVRASAKHLVEDWRQMHRKRKSSGNLADAIEQPAVKQAMPAPSEGGHKEAAQGGSVVQDGPRLEKADSFFSNGSLADMDGLSQCSGGSTKLDPYREKVLQKLIEALGKEEEIETRAGEKGEERQRDPVVLAGEMEEALNAAKPKKEAYLSQARSVIYNLKDPKNPTFRFKLMVGFYRPEDVPGLTAEDMASDEKNAERAEQRRYAMEEIQTDWALKHGQQRITGMFTCGKCKGTKTTYFQMQTRSSDEPMTTFVTCLSCNNRWKFC